MVAFVPCSPAANNKKEGEKGFMGCHTQMLEKGRKQSYDEEELEVLQRTKTNMALGGIRQSSSFGVLFALLFIIIFSYFFGSVCFALILSFLHLPID